MMKNHMQESEIAKNIEAREKSHYPEFQVKDFIVSQTSGYWFITFTYLTKAGWELHIKRNGKRQFKSLNAVGECMKRMGVKEWRVIFE